MKCHAVLNLICDRKSKDAIDAFNKLPLMQKDVVVYYFWLYFSDKFINKQRIPFIKCHEEFKQFISGNFNDDIPENCHDIATLQSIKDDMAYNIDLHCNEPDYIELLINEDMGLLDTRDCDKKLDTFG